jgi:hypothetical protein
VCQTGLEYKHLIPCPNGVLNTRPILFFSRTRRRAVYRCIKKKKRGASAPVQKGPHTNTLTNTTHTHPHTHKHTHGPGQEAKLPRTGHHSNSPQPPNDQTQLLIRGAGRYFYASAAWNFQNGARGSCRGHMASQPATRALPPFTTNA